MSKHTRRAILLKGVWLSLGAACAVVTGSAAAPSSRPTSTAAVSGHDQHRHAGTKVKKRLRITAKRKDKDPHRVFDVTYDESDSAVDAVTVDSTGQDFQVMKDTLGVTSHLRPFDAPYRTSEGLMVALLEFYEYGGFSMG